MDLRTSLPNSSSKMLPAATMLTPSSAEADLSRRLANDSAKETTKVKEAFTDFVGQTLFGSMLASMRKTVGKPAYMHGGRTEEVFQKQLDQKIVEELTDASASSIADPMYDLFNMQRSS